MTIHSMNIPEFHRGQIYKRSAIHDEYGGTRQSGIAPSRRAPAVFIFTGDSGKQFGYADSWDASGLLFTYTGEGQVDDMTMDGGNAAIRDHVEEGRALHLFEIVPRRELKSLGFKMTDKGYCRYLGEMQCAGVIDARGPDKNGTERAILQFQLVRVDAVDELREPKTSTSDTSVPATAVIDLGDLRRKAVQAARSETRKARDAQRTLYERARSVVEYALARANGTCEACGMPAPFHRLDGTPYLEVHHTDRLSDGGLDAPHRVAAICPTCHRRIHCGDGGDAINEDLRVKIEAIEIAMSGRHPKSSAPHQ